MGGVTMKDMCETIVRVHNERRAEGLPSFLPDPLAQRDDLDPRRDIYEFDASGELWPVFEFYDRALSADV